MNEQSAAERRKDAYENCLTIEFPEGSGELITYDNAGKMHANYSAVGDADTATYLAQEMIKAKRYIKELFPDD